MVSYPRLAADFTGGLLAAAPQEEATVPDILACWGVVIQLKLPASFPWPVYCFALYYTNSINHVWSPLMYGVLLPLTSTKFKLGCSDWCLDAALLKIRRNLQLALHHVSNSKLHL